MRANRPCPDRLELEPPPFPTDGTIPSPSAAFARARRGDGLRASRTPVVVRMRQHGCNGSSSSWVSRGWRTAGASTATISSFCPHARRARLVRARAVGARVGVKLKGGGRRSKRVLTSVSQLFVVTNLCGSRNFDFLPENCSAYVP